MPKPERLASSQDDEPPPSPTTPNTEQFFFDGSGLSALLVHGLTGTPYEMRYLGERLAATGIRVLGVKLAGHAGAPEELGDTTYNSWYESVVSGFEELRRYREPIVVIGLSLGAVLSARLTIDQRDEVAALVMLSPAFFLNTWNQLGIRVARKFSAYTRSIYLHSSHSDIYDAAARDQHPSARLMPLSGPMNLFELSAMVRPRLGKITQPTLVIHAAKDHVAPIKNVDFLMKNLGAADKRAVILERSYHVITVDVEKDKVVAEVLGFIAPFRLPVRRSAAG